MTAAHDNGDHDASDAAGAWRGQSRNPQARSAAVRGRSEGHHIWALVYIDDHPEVIAGAKSQIAAWFAGGVFGKRAQKAFKEHLGIEQSQGDRSVANG